MRLWLSTRLGHAVLAAGLLSQAAGAATWFPLGPFGGDARSIAADPADPSKHLFLGTATGWIYDSRDGGRSWTRIAQIAHRNDLVVDHIVVDQKNPKRLIVAAFTVDHPDGGLFISEDDGKEWYSQAEMRGQSVRALARSVSDPKILVAGTLKGVFRSMDNGVHWKQISPETNGEIKEVQSIAIDPRDPNVIYAGTWHLPWKTTDGGATWHNIKEGIIDDSDVFSIIVDPTQPNVVYASACSGIYKSVNAGELFHKVQGIPSTARRTRKLTQDPQHLNVVFAGTTEGLYRTVDAGSKWDRLTPGDVIVNDVYVDPTDASHVLLATDRGGVYRSDDGGSNFELSSSGFSARQVIAYAADEQNDRTVYVGVVNGKATGGVFQSTDGAVHWQQQSEGLGGRDVFSLVSLTDGTLLAGTGHGIFRLASGTWTDSSLLMTAPAAASATMPAVSRRPAGAAKTAQHVGTAREHARLFRNVGFPLQSSSPKKKQGAKTEKRSTHAAVTRGRVSSSRQKAATKTTSTRRRNPAAPLPNKEAVAPAGSRDALAAATAQARRDPRKVAANGRLDTVVYSLVRSRETLFAGSATGLLRSDDAGQHWTAVSSLVMPEVHFLAILPPAKESSDASAVSMLLAAGLQRLAFSPDGGATWDTVALPADLTQIGAIGIDGDKNLWVGGREGVWLSTDYGATWKGLRNLFVTEVNSIFYDAPARRVLVTASASPVAFSVQLPDYKVTYWDTGWRLRFVRPVGDHLVGGTLFDGIVVQPQMVESPLPASAPGMK